ncbi:hypothetical protein L3Q72_06600 [Vibrio sp. JC009]|uniref:hypothetical protein n=1 Tax=Vibrio sp. JC009 TaxID=2912314 RepID=UPI0023B0B709|nr:hypothetical protein [Vibrio sp. JC009]WED23339.1 hypothetical protein L3Q72_06600 [Vibrio sp. JC009]
MRPITQTALEQAVQPTATTNTTGDYSKSTDTLPHRLGEQVIHLSPQEWINTKFVEAYGAKWPHRELPSTWAQGITTMSTAEIRKAVSMCLTEGGAWPPSLPEFIAKGELMEIDFDAAFSRMIRGNPKGDVEYWASQEVGYMCRCYLAEPKARAKHRDTLKKYIGKAKAGTLPVRNLMRIEDKSYEEEIAKRESPDPSRFPSGSVFARIAELGRRT